MTLFQEQPGLLDAFRRGESQALTAVFHRYVDEVSRLIRRGCLLKGGGRLLGIAQPDTERDLVQEVFTRAFTRGAREVLDEARLYRPYLMTIARNALADHWRQFGRTAEVLEPGQLDRLEGPPAELCEEEDLDWRRRREATREYLARLPVELREFARLRFEEEHSQAQLVGALGLTRWRIRALEAQLVQGLVEHLERSHLLANRPAPEPAARSGLAGVDPPRRT